MSTVPHVSEPVAVPVAAGLVSPVHSTVALSGQVIDGGVVSTTVIVCAQLVLCPHWSVAVQVRVIVSVFPQPGTETSLLLIVTVPQVSEPVAEPLAATLVSAGHSSVWFAGQVIDGLVVSTTVIV